MAARAITATAQPLSSDAPPRNVQHSTARHSTAQQRHCTCHCTHDTQQRPGSWHTGPKLVLKPAVRMPAHRVFLCFLKTKQDLRKPHTQPNPTSAAQPDSRVQATIQPNNSVQVPASVTNVTPQSLNTDAPPQSAQHSTAPMPRNNRASHTHCLLFAITKFIEAAAFFFVYFLTIYIGCSTASHKQSTVTPCRQSYGPHCNQHVLHAFMLIR